MIIISVPCCEIHRLVLKIFLQNKRKRRLRLEVLLFRKHLTMKEIQQRFHCALSFSFYPELWFKNAALIWFYFLCQAIEGFTRRYSVPLDLVYRKVDGEYPEPKHFVGLDVFICVLVVKP